MSTHVNQQNIASMVDISNKSATVRTAVAAATVSVSPQISAMLSDGEIQSKKGPVFQTAVLAGTMGAKETSRLIPLCHPLPLEDCQLEITLRKDLIEILCTCKTTGKTGVEMEALTGASIAALTIYDMCKSLDPAIELGSIRLLKKTGGKSDFNASR